MTQTTLRIPQDQIEALLQAVDPVALIERLGLEVHGGPGRHTTFCLNHEDSNPSLKVYERNPRHPYHCFACGWNPSPIEMVQKALGGCSFIDAVEFLADLSGYRPDGLGKPADLAKPPQEPPALPVQRKPQNIPMGVQSGAVGVLLQALLDLVPDSCAQALHYLARERSIDPHMVSMVGPCYALPGQVIPELTRLLLVSPRVEDLRAAGILVERHGREQLVWFDDGILFASLDRSGNRHVYLRQRRTEIGDDKRSPRYLGQGGGDGTWVVPYGLPAVRLAAQKHLPLLIVEGAPDALSSISWGIPALAVLGRPGFSNYLHAGSTSQGRTFEHLVGLLTHTAMVAVLPDNDAKEASRQEGLLKAVELVRWLRVRRIPSRLVSMDDLGLGTHKDLNDALIAGAQLKKDALRP